jgi:hypothetical protein
MQPGFGRRSTQQRLGFTRWWIRTSVNQIIVSLIGLPHIYFDIFIIACFCHIGGATWLLVFVKCRHSIFIKKLILKPYTKFEFKPNKQTRMRRRGEVTARQTRWHRICKTDGTDFGQYTFPLHRLPSRNSKDFSRDLGLSRNSGEKSEVSGFH